MTVLSQLGRYLVNRSTFHSVTDIKAEIEDCSVTMIPGKPLNFSILLLVHV